MKNILVLLAVAAVAAMSIGCGGGGGASLGAGPPKGSPFGGRYSGTWKALAVGHNGEATVTVGADGSCSGTVLDRQSGETGRVAGSIALDGSFAGSVAYQGQSYSLAGSFRATAAGMDGTLTQDGQGHSFSVDFRLKRAP